MKKPNVQLLAICLAIGLLFSVLIGVHETPNTKLTTKPVIQMLPSAEVWSDDFEDGDISDWEVVAANMSTDPGVEIEGNVSSTEGVLRILGSDLHIVYHDSSVAYGTWTFDVDLQRPDLGESIYVTFLGSEYTEDWLIHDYTDDGYFLRFLFTEDTTEGNIAFYESSVDDGWVGRATYEVDDFVGWKTIIITRDPTGQFYVYLDGEFAIGVKDNTLTTSESFTYMGRGNPALDNITVSNSVDYDKAPPEWIEALEDKEVAAGAAFEYDVSATDYSGIDQYWIDDTDNFAIDDDGVITNEVSLVAGTYPITVGVNDTLGNARTEAFDLVVTAGAIPMELLLISAGVVGVVIIVLVLWRIRKP